MSVASGFEARASDGRRLLLGKLVKSGGAGSIYLLPASPLQVAKVYHDSANRGDYERKVAAMLALSPNLPDIFENGQRYVQIAWPQALLRDGSGAFLGFAMPAVDIDATSELECILQERQAKAAGLPTGLGAKITLAANLAAVIAELHRQGHHVIDLKPVNLRFYPRSLYMAMLDCDGFGIQGRGERFAADQITPDYLAPEFQNGTLATAGEEQQDRFALAVVVFQLLNFGIHPYSGRPLSDNVPTDIPGRIARRCYPYGTHAHRELMPSPVSGHKAMPADLRLLFDRAFDGAGGSRPTPGEWADTLKGYAQRSSRRLVACGKDALHQHFAGMPCAACARVALLTATAAQARAATPSLRPSMSPPTQVRAPVRATGIRSPHLRPGARPTAPVGGAAPQGWSVSQFLQAPAPAPKQKLAPVLFVLFIAAMMVWNAIQKNLLPARPPAGAATADHFDFPVDVRAPRKQMRTVLYAAASGDVTSVQNLLGRMSRAPANAPSAGDLDDRTRFERFAAYPGDWNGAERRELADQALAMLRRNPANAEAAWEAGWLALLAHQPFKASNAFAEAIWANPLLYKAWYGYGLASGDERETVGAFVLVGLMGHSADMDVLYPREFIHSAGIHPVTFAMLQARARLILGPSGEAHPASGRPPEANPTDQGASPADPGAASSDASQPER